MPHTQLFTVCDPVINLTKDYSSRVFIPVNSMKTIERLRSLDGNVKIQEEIDSQDIAQRPTFRRQRSQTLPNVDLHSSKRIEMERKRKQQHPLRLSRSLEFEARHRGPVAKSSSRPRTQSLHGQQRVSFVQHHTVRNQRPIKDVQRFNYHRPSMEQSATSDFILRRSIANRSRQKTSHSFPSDDMSSIYSIVKARSLALKWYRGKDGNTTRAKRKQSVPLPTIDDKKIISLSKAKCSPQFAEVVHLLQEDEAVEDIEDDLQVLSLD